MLKLTAVFSSFLAFTFLLGCSQDDNSYVKMENFTVGSKPFSNKNLDRVCIYPDGTKLPKNTGTDSTAPYGKITIIEHKNEDIVVTFADNDVLNHDYPIKLGTPHCFERPDDIVVKQGDGILLLATD
ncbi:hypothetical protein [Roseibium sp. Sym1]|uniref:hypothetical protein n=1 Tax=Roseibium sp. Sym1 TaxID=3016006 RepID=UPI0022B4C3F1|nr:hypothetical protein [Roseibium sp. Sym1]